MQLNPQELKPGQKVWAVRVKYPDSYQWTQNPRTSHRPVMVTIARLYDPLFGITIPQVITEPPGVDAWVQLSTWVWEFYDNYWEARKRHIQACPYKEALA